MDHHTLTGIPIEWLFGALAGLLGIVYASITYQLRQVIRQSARNHVRLVRVTTYLGFMSAKLGVPFRDGEDDE